MTVYRIFAIGSLDGTRSIIDWKTTTSRYPEAPMGLLSLDSQLISYSWVTGISEVASVASLYKSYQESQRRVEFSGSRGNRVKAML